MRSGGPYGDLDRHALGPTPTATRHNIRPGCFSRDRISQFHAHKLLWSLMHLSTNLPSGPKAVREYIANRGESRLPMNVSAEADAAYVAEKDLRLGPVILKSWPVGTCARCNGVIHNAPFLRNAEPGKFCSRECRDNGGSRTAKRGRPKGAKDRSFITRANKKYASGADRVRAFREKNSLQNT